jgi:hypothetical protein
LQHNLEAAHVADLESFCSVKAQVYQGNIKNDHT